MYEFLPPNQASFTVSSDQYAKILLVLKSDKEVVNLNISDNQVSASIDGVEFLGVFNGSVLTITITKVHSLAAHLFGNKKIFDILADRLAKGL